MVDAQNRGVNFPFAWYDDKAASNREKHGVSFEEAGHSTRNRFLLVCFTERGDALRIFTTRPATRKERQDYERHTHL
jgi:uncharacterized DUF497 family protein